MNRLAAIALSVAGMFLIVMAVLVNSPPLFYMTVAVLTTLAASRLQAYLAIRGLRFERTFPPSVSIGEVVTIETIVWSERKIRRPLVTVEDVLPNNLPVADRTPALPVAPAFDQPIRTKFTFKPLRRGRFRWRKIVVRGTDALGLVVLDKEYAIDPVELTVYPVPLPVSLDIRPSVGWGVSDLDSGLVRGSGIDPRGIREYVPGDPVKHIHWRSSARSGKLMVKEFDTGSGLNMAFVLQRTQGTDVGPAGASTFEAACGHVLHLASNYIERGALVWFPGLEPIEDSQQHPDVRSRAVREILTDIQANRKESVTVDLAAQRFVDGATVAIVLSTQDVDLPGFLAGQTHIRKICLVYNAKEFDPRTNFKLATDPAYLAELERAGVEVHVMPFVEAVA